MGTNEYEDYLRKYHETDIYNISNGAKLPYEIVIDYENLEQVNSQLADLIIDKSDDCISKFQQAVRNLDVNSHNLLDKYGDEICSIRFKNLSEITPIRELTAENVGKLIQTKAIINNYSAKHELIIKRAVFECRSCMRLHEIEQDSKTLIEPTLCKECGGRSFKLLDDESTYVNFKELILSEPLEESEKGNSQKITAIITGENEFVDKIREYGEHGKRINVVGKLRMFKQDNTMYTGLEINNIWNDNDSSIILTDEDINEFKEWAKNDNLLDDLVNKFAPNIVYANEIKLALLCQNVGAGYLGNDRKEIHIIIVGDKGIGKSRLANATTNLYEIYQKATGTGSTGVGFIGAVDRDSINGGWTYQAGKLILADGGLAVIDEFDKLNQDDQPKLNDIMQDGKTSIDKADVHVYPKSDVSILALANPIGSKFDLYHNKIKQIDIAGSTFDRFDGAFILTSKEYDREKHMQIRKMKFQSYKQSNDDLEDMEKLKKYLTYVKKEFNPPFTPESEKQAMEYHKKIYDGYNLTESEGQRKHDSLDRFAGAIAKLRQHKSIEPADVQKAYCIIKYMSKQIDVELED